MCELCNNKIIGEICLRCHKQKIQEAKKEVFDDFEDNVFQQLRTLIYQGNSLQTQCNLIKEWKQRHLSTFADGKSDIIADKQNPSKENIRCPKCNKLIFTAFQSERCDCAD